MVLELEMPLFVFYSLRVRIRLEGVRGIARIPL